MASCACDRRAGERRDAAEAEVVMAEEEQEEDRNSSAPPRPRAILTRRRVRSPKMELAVGARAEAKEEEA